MAPTCFPFCHNFVSTLRMVVSQRLIWFPNFCLSSLNFDPRYQHAHMCFCYVNMWIYGIMLFSILTILHVSVLRTMLDWHFKKTVLRMRCWAFSSTSWKKIHRKFAQLGTVILYVLMVLEPWKSPYLPDMPCHNWSKEAFRKACIVLHAFRVLVCGILQQFLVPDIWNKLANLRHGMLGSNHDIHHLLREPWQNSLGTALLFCTWSTLEGRNPYKGTYIFPAVFLANLLLHMAKSLTSFLSLEFDACLHRCRCLLDNDASGTLNLK